jgi:hypothetical protein
MRSFTYHEGQREIQQEAKTTQLADTLSSWVGPVARFAGRADLIVLARLDNHKELQIAVMSGAAPLVSTREIGQDILIQFPQALASHILPETLIGGIAISPSEYLRARIYGTVKQGEGTLELRCQNAMNNCRKYIYPSVSVGQALHIGPHSRQLRPLDDPDVLRILAKTVTSFLVTAQPDESPDVSHRGGEPGFLEYDPAQRHIQWTDYLGDGMFMSAGNIRATGKFKLIAFDLETGDGVEVACIEGGYQNLRPSRKERVESLIQSEEPFEVQGKMGGTVEAVYVLHQLCHPRQHIAKKQPVTSCTPVEEQYFD